MTKTERKDKWKMGKKEGHGWIEKERDRESVRWGFRKLCYPINIGPISAYAPSVIC